MAFVFEVLKLRESVGITAVGSAKMEKSNYDCLEYLTERFTLYASNLAKYCSDQKALQR